MTQQPAAGAIKPETIINRMFGRITKRYDLMNHLMTFGQDFGWRRRVVKTALGAGDELALDVATGTGGVAFALADAGYRHVIGLDFVPEMIAVAESRRFDRADLTFVVGDAMDLPYPNDHFDAVTVSFGLRNMPDYLGAISEMTRVVKPGGRFICLELTPYRKPILGRIFNWYFTRIVPVIGGLLSGDREAYEYLPTSVASFPDAEAVIDLMRTAGLRACEYEMLGFGTVALHVGIKPIPQAPSP